MDKSLTAADIMTREVVALPEAMSVLEAAQRLLERGVSGAPVIDKEERLVGVLSEEDLLGVIYEGHRDLARTEIGRCAVLGSSLVTRRVISVGPDASAADIARTMMLKRIKRVPVVDADRRVIGIVSRKNILRAMVAREAAKR